MLLLRCLVVLGALGGLHGRIVELNWTVNGVEAYDLRYIWHALLKYARTREISSCQQPAWGSCMPSTADISQKIYIASKSVHGWMSTTFSFTFAGSRPCTQSINRLPIIYSGRTTWVAYTKCFFRSEEENFQHVHWQIQVHRIKSVLYCELPWGENKSHIKQLTAPNM